MASSIAKPCANHAFGCSETTKSGKFCAKCKRCGFARENRASSASRGYDRNWQVERLNFLRSNPFCFDPFQIHFKRGEFRILASCVDHKIPHKGNKELFWNQSNWQSLCETCHNRKTVQFDGGFSRPHKKNAS